MKHLPGKKYIFLIFGVIIIGGLFLTTNKKGSLPKVDSPQAKNPASALIQKDTDNDGLNDWEEALWKTDIKNPDTDGDGTLDGTEIAQNRDPLKPGPDDTLNKEEIKNKAIATDTLSPNYDSNNLTQEIAKNLSSGIMRGEEGVDLSDPIALINNQGTSDELDKYLLGLNPSVSNSELKISADNSPKNVERYFTEFMKSKPKDPYPTKTEEISFNEIVESGNSAIAKTYQNYYLSLASNIKNVTAPSDFLDIHRRSIELFMATAKIYEGLSDIKNDPLKAIVAIQQNARIRAETGQVLTNLISKIENIE